LFSRPNNYWYKIRMYLLSDWMRL